jgi:predicted regulator of Ras-like GTPase activity (Roadblock/LC7/MglB family)
VAEAPAAPPLAAVESGSGLEEAARETVLIPPLELILGDRTPAPEQPAAEEVKVSEAFPEIADAPLQTNGEHPVALTEEPVTEPPAEAVVLPPLELTPEPVALVAEPEAPAAETVQAQESAPAPEPIRISLSEFAPHVESDAALQAILMSDEDMDAKTVVRLVSKLPGISGCTVMFGDGFRLAGNFPEEGQAEGFSAMAPVFYKRAATFAEEVRFGDLQTLTLYTGDGLLSFFMDADICLSVKHSGRGFLPGVREKLQGVTREMAVKYAAAHSAPIPN